MISDDDDCVQLYLEKMVVPVESGGGEVCCSYTSAKLVRALVLLYILTFVDVDASTYQLAVCQR